MSRKSRKLTLQYAYLQLEHEEVDELCSGIEAKMRSYLKDKYPEYYETFFSTPENLDKVVNQEEEVEEEDENEEEVNAATPPKNRDLKKLYRKIVEKTHPDKVGNNSQAALFSAAAKAYKTNNIAKLLNIAGTLNLELIELSPESLYLLEENIKTLSDNIVKKKNTTAWKWTQCSTDAEKNEIIKVILRHKGVEL